MVSNLSYGTRLSRALKMYDDFVDWPFRVVTRRAHLLCRQGKGPAAP